MIVEKVNNIELEFNGSKAVSNNCNQNSKCIYKPKSGYNNETINISEMMMNEVFNNSMNLNVEPVKKDVDIIDIDEIIGDIKEKEEVESKVVFDLKKEVISNDNESVVSGSTTTQLTKKQLMKLNVDKLKEKCNELQISSEGTKAQIIDRILDETNKDV